MPTVTYTLVKTHIMFCNCCLLLTIDHNYTVTELCLLESSGDTLQVSVNSETGKCNVFKINHITLCFYSQSSALRIETNICSYKIRSSHNADMNMAVFYCILGSYQLCSIDINAVN